MVSGLAWDAGPATLQLLYGIQATNFRGYRWTGAHLALGIGRSSALLLTARHQWHAGSVRVPALSVGVRSSYWHWGKGVPVERPPRRERTLTAPSPVIRVRADGDAVRLDILAPTATYVAVAGDATDWEPVYTKRNTDGWWTVSLRLANTVSRIQMQSDEGGWRPIPGLPTTRDEYGGVVSLLTPIESGPTPPPRP